MGMEYYEQSYDSLFEVRGFRKQASELESEPLTESG
jgi:hypothetical protein